MTNTKDGVRHFETGATRSDDSGKLDFDGFYSPIVMRRFAQYMHKCRKLPDGTMRDSGNWKAGIPIKQYIKSLWRHFFAVWSWFNGYDPDYVDIEEELCAVIFNAQGVLHEHLKAKGAEAANVKGNKFVVTNPIPRSSESGYSIMGGEVIRARDERIYGQEDNL